MLVAEDVNGNRVWAKPNQRALCPLCHTDMIAKCGTERVHHWAHRSLSECDTWMETESRWHEWWKKCFDADQVDRVVHRGDAKRFADVRHENGTVLKLQQSPLKEGDFQLREEFFGYENLIWIVDAKAKDWRFDYEPIAGSNRVRFTWKQPKKWVARVQAYVYLDIGEGATDGPKRRDHRSVHRIRDSVLEG